MIRRILAPLSSLTLTVVLIVLAMVLIYAGTWAQVDTGIWQVQKQYFHSFFTWIDFQTFWKRPAPGEPGISGGFPMLGGYSIGLLMLINLVAAHMSRFRYNASRIGVILIHVGLILLLVGEGVTSGMATESRMTIDQGRSASFSEDYRKVELAVVDPSPADHDDVTVISGSRLEQGGLISDRQLPFDVQVDEYFPNSILLGPMQAGADARPRATAGSGRGITVIGRPLFSGKEAEQTDRPSAYVTLSRDGNALGTYLVSTYPIAPFDAPQSVQAGGKTYQIELRFKRYYKPYSLELIKFSHDRYQGTDVPRNFSSLVVLSDPAHHEHRQVLIKMNSPLRYRDETFYQASFLPGDKTTILQVVSNPAWLLPYVACVIGGAGMFIHFLIHLLGFMSKRKQAQLQQPAVKASAGGRAAIPALLTAAALLVTYMVWASFSPSPAGASNLEAFGKIPVLYEGRVQPLDSLARNGLKIISGKQTLSIDGHRAPAIQWLADAMARPEKADAYPVFLVNHPGIVGVLGLDAGRRRFSFNEIVANEKVLQEQFKLAGEAEQRSDYQEAVLSLRSRLELYLLFSQEVGNLYLCPPLKAGEQWQPLGKGLATEPATGRPHPSAEALRAIIGSYGQGQSEQFNELVSAYRGLLASRLPQVARKSAFESAFNLADPFLLCMTLYLIAFVLTCCAWLAWTTPLLRSAFWVLLVALVIHTAGLAARVYMSDRPPVTNLASSAIFIAWGAVILALFLERVFRNGIGSITAAAMGFLSLLVADRLSLEGDTMKVLVAVLDTNFWLATHVVMITLGYASTFLAGFLGIVYVLRGLFTRSLTRPQGHDLARMIYGIVCFAMLFSFVGTILGGIWADQSWGRFWGWDPKENGAALLVLWNALILHAHWSRMARDRGLALLAIGGNIITSWSWFGTNMLGVGLHSYGFMASALFWLLMFVFSQLLLIGIGSWPLSQWRSGAALVQDADEAAAEAAAAR